MPWTDKKYSAYWAASGIARPNTVLQFWRDKRQADRRWAAERPTAIAELGAVNRLSILPLVEYYSAVEGLATEPGVSYLVTFDDEKLLFDVGWNMRNEHPSPLLRNMKVLGVSADQLDEVFISHGHLDHVGGRRSQIDKTFALSAQPVDLEGVRIFVPPPLTYPTGRVTVVDKPRRLAPGVASSGPLMRAIWLTGPVLEQNLLVNVAGKGVVMIVGCGHPSLSRMVERAQAVTGWPLYGVVGGLHFPVTGSRVGKGRQNIVGNGKLPWQRITREEAREAAALLADLDLGLVALSAHDSCDWSLGVFKEALGERYRTLKAGEEIIIA
ncbi:MAG: MBL fold metallo-hydrolase [Thermoleophilia bacterium]|nr:MBL fold metallo-hydrolase [Thermoleophilia bacterium]